MPTPLQKESRMFSSLNLQKGLKHINPQLVKDYIRFISSEESLLRYSKEHLQQATTLLHKLEQQDLLARKELYALLENIRKLASSENIKMADLPIKHLPAQIDENGEVYQPEYNADTIEDLLDNIEEDFSVDELVNHILGIVDNLAFDLSYKHKMVKTICNFDKTTKTLTLKGCSQLDNLYAIRKELEELEYKTVARELLTLQSLPTQNIFNTQILEQLARVHNFVMSEFADAETPLAGKVTADTFYLDFQKKSARFYLETSNPLIFRTLLKPHLIQILSNEGGREVSSKKIALLLSKKHHKVKNKISPIVSQLRDSIKKTFNIDPKIVIPDGVSKAGYRIGKVTVVIRPYRASHKKSVGTKKGANF